MRSQSGAGHSDLNDAKSEAELYQNVSDYIQLLNNWKCDSLIFNDCILDLSRHLAIRGIWKQQDALVAEAWLADLTSVEYDFPQIDDVNNIQCVKENSFSSINFYPVEQNSSIQYDESLIEFPRTTNGHVIRSHLKSYCSDAHALRWGNNHQSDVFSRTLLIIAIEENPETTIPLLETFYKVHFAHILYCTVLKVNPDFVTEWKISVVVLNSERVDVMSCLHAARGIKYANSNVLYITGRVWLNMRAIQSNRNVNMLWRNSMHFKWINAYSPMKSDNVHVIPWKTFVRIVEELGPEISKVWQLTAGHLRQCFQRKTDDVDLFSKNNGDVTVPVDTVVNIPLRLVSDLRDLQRKFHARKLQKYDYLALTFLECKEQTTYHMQSTSVLDRSTTKDYVFPVTFASDPSNKTAQSFHCNEFAV